MSIDSKDHASLQKAPNDSTLTLAQVRAKIANNSELDAHFSHLPGPKQVIVKDCTRGHLNCSGKMTMVGRHTKYTRLFSIWACLHSRKPNGGPNKVSYSWKNTLKPQEVPLESLKDIEFCEPFSGIVNPETSHNQDKIRFLVLYYLLANKQIDKIDFEGQGFELLRIAVKQAAAHSIALKKAAASSTSNPAPSKSMVKPKQNAAGVSATPVQGKNLPSKDTIATATVDTARGNKRDRDVAEADERQPKRPVIEGLHHLENFVQQIRQPIDTENEKLKTEITKLRSEHTAMQQQRDHWQNNARFVKDQLKVTEEERHAITAKFEDLEKTSKADKKLLDTAKFQLRTSEFARTKMAQEMDDQKNSLQSELEGFKGWKREKGNLEKELEGLRSFETQVRQLAASRNGVQGTV